MELTDNLKKTIEQQFLHDFFSAPIDTTARAMAALKHAGYFDFSVLYRQFYDPMAALLRPQFIVYYVLFGVVVFWINRSTLQSNVTMREYIFPRRILKRKSFWLDVQWYVLNLLRVISGVTALLGLLILVRFLSNYLDGIGYDDLYAVKRIRTVMFGLPKFPRTLLLFLSVVVTLDFVNYWMHRLMHHVPMLWNFHKVHHYPRQITLLASWRVHPLEQALSDFLGKLIALGAVVI